MEEPAGLLIEEKEGRKEEVEDASAGTFRDFRKGKRNGAGDAKKVKQASVPKPIRLLIFPATSRRMSWTH